MRYCHECSSEVGELDIFCPYCGISMPGAADAGDAAVDPLASTIVFSSPFDLPVESDRIELSGTEPELAEAVTIDVPDALVSNVPIPALLTADQLKITAEDVLVEKIPLNSGKVITELPVGETELAKRFDIVEEGAPSSDLSDKTKSAEIDNVEHDISLSGETGPDPGEQSQLDTNDGDEAAVADTGDDLISEEPHSHTTPQIGTINTDGRKSGLKPLPEGTVLNNRYDIVKKIGGGGMGAVYLATDRNLGGVMRAVKEMVQSHIEEEQQEKAIDDFKRESMILSALS